MCEPLYKVLNLLTPVELYVFQHVPSTKTTTMGTRQIHHPSERAPQGYSNCSGQSNCLKRMGHKQWSEGGGREGDLKTSRADCRPKRERLASQLVSTVGVRTRFLTAESR
jgi:hypothetical protein